MATVKLDKPKLRLLESFHRNKSKKLIKLRQDNKFCDLTLKCDDGFEIKVHRLVVSSASKYFEDLLTTPMIEMHQDCITLPDITGVVLEKIILFIYTSDFKEKIEDIEKIIKYAVIFQLQELIEICSSILVENITDYSCVRYWRLAKDNLIYVVENKSFSYIVNKAYDLFQKELLNGFTIEEMKCLLAEDSLYLQSNEQTIFEHVWKWTTGKVSDTITFPEIFSQVVDLLRFSKLNPNFLVERIFCNDQLLENVDLLKQIGKLTRKQILQDDNDKTTNKQKLQNVKDELAIKKVSISKMTSRKLLGFGCNQMLKGIGEEGHGIINEKELPLFCAYTTFNNNLFICGGLSSTSCEWLEPISEKWQKLPSLKSPKQYHACSYFDNKIYVCGGFGGNSVEVFDFGKQKWHSGPDMVVDISNFGLTPANGSLYAIGVNDDIQILDSREKEWSVINSNLPKIGLRCECVGVGPIIYCFYHDQVMYSLAISELDGYIYSLAFDMEMLGLELAQYHLDGTRGYTNYVGLYPLNGTCKHANALVALNY